MRDETDLSGYRDSLEPSEMKLDELWSKVSLRVSERTSGRRRRITFVAAPLFAVLLMGGVAVAAPAVVDFFGRHNESPPRDQMNAASDPSLPLASKEVSAALARDEFVQAREASEPTATALDERPRVLVASDGITLSGVLGQPGKACYVTEEVVGSENVVTGVTCGSRLHQAGLMYGINFRVFPDRIIAKLVGLYADDVSVSVEMLDGTRHKTVMENNGFIWTGTARTKALIATEAGHETMIPLDQSPLPVS